MGNSIHRAIACSVSLAVLALLAPQVFSFPCERMSASGDCQEVWNSGLSDGEKLEVVASMIDNIKDWNSAFSVRDPPVGTSIYNDDIVQGAWIREMAVMPSVYENGNLLSPGYGTVVSKGWYDIVTPSGTEGGDCRTDYSLYHTSRIEQLLNGAYLGTGEVLTFDSSSSPLDFKANLVINIELYVSHYRWVRSGRRYKCLYAGVETRKRTVVVSDSVRALRHQSAIPYTFKIENEYYGIKQVSFNASSYDWYRIQFNPDSYYEEHLIEFDPFFRLEPYYLLNYEPRVNKSVNFHNIHFVGSSYQVNSLSGCTITLGDYFRNYTYPCPLDYTPLNLQISTDKTRYNPGEEIRVIVSPDVSANITYGDSSIMGRGSVVFPAQYGVGLVSAKASGVEAIRMINVSNPSLWTTVSDIILGLFLLYLLWLLFKKYVGVSE